MKTEWMKTEWTKTSDKIIIKNLSILPLKKNKVVKFSCEQIYGFKENHYLTKRRNQHIDKKQKRKKKPSKATKMYGFCELKEEDKKKKLSKMKNMYNIHNLEKYNKKCII